MSIAVAFIMAISLAVMGEQFFQCQQNVVRDIRIGVFVDRDPSGGMRAEDGYRSGLDAAFGKGGVNRFGDVDHFISLVCLDTLCLVGRSHGMAPDLHLLNDLDAQQFTETVPDRPSREIAQQQSYGLLIRIRFEDRAGVIESAEYLSQVVEIGG